MHGRCFGSFECARSRHRPQVWCPLQARHPLGQWRHARGWQTRRLGPRVHPIGAAATRSNPVPPCRGIRASGRRWAPARSHSFPAPCPNRRRWGVGTHWTANSASEAETTIWRSTKRFPSGRPSIGRTCAPASRARSCPERWNAPLRGCTARRPATCEAPRSGGPSQMHPRCASWTPRRRSASCRLALDPRPGSTPSPPKPRNSTAHPHPSPNPRSVAARGPPTPRPTHPGFHAG